MGQIRRLSFRPLLLPATTIPPLRKNSSSSYRRVLQFVIPREKIFRISESRVPHEQI